MDWRVLWLKKITRLGLIRGCYEFRFGLERKMRHFRRFRVGDDSEFLSVHCVKIELALMRRQLMKWWACGRLVQQGMDAQKDPGISKQAQAPSQLQTVQEGGIQPQLVLFVRLSRFDPRADLLDQALRRQARQRQQAKQCFVLTGGKGELARTDGRLPAPRTTLRRLRHAKPMLPFPGRVFQPAQRLALMTLDPVPRDVGIDQFHVRAQSGHDRDIPARSAKRLEFGTQVTHVGHHNLRPPLPALLTVTQTRCQQSAIEEIGRRHPGHQGHQQDRLRMLPPPQTQGVLFVTDVPAALTGLKGPLAQGGAMGGIRLGFFFLKPSQAASKSVASIKATAWDQAVARSINGRRSWSLIWRRPLTPKSDRNWWSMRASGIRSRWENRANERQARCSASSANTWLREWTGVRTVNKWVRHNWAALKCRRGPRAGRKAQCSLIKPSGIKASTSSLSDLGRRFFQGNLNAEGRRRVSQAWLHASSILITTPH